jgi:tRNA A-37 threonylcarbamoyl transferase component Bud32
MNQIGRYKIVKELGRGAMGAVYKALDPQIDRTVAIKVILTANLPAAELENYKQRFYREARAAGKMSHGGIVTIYDITEDTTGQPYLVMEFIEGRTLEGVLEQQATGGPRLSTAQALAIGLQVARALDYAHRRGVVHRDVKPANILLTDEGVAKIADFGIAKMEGVQLTQTGHMLGTPAFMAPEQFSGDVVDARSDLFSLGSILYWLLTGEKPFAADTLSMVTYKVVFADPPAPTAVNAALPPGTDAVLDRCLAKKSALRYPSCKELADDLEALAAGRVVLAKPLSPEERAAAAAPVVAGAGAGGAATERTQRTEPAMAPAAAPSLEKTTATPAAKMEQPAVDKTVATPVALRAGAPAPTARTGRRKWLYAAIVVLVVFLGNRWVNRSGTAPPGQKQSAATTVEKPREPEVQPVVATPAPAEEPPSGPPPHAQAKGRRGRSPGGATATLRIECWHNFRDGVLEISVGGSTVHRAGLRGAETDLSVLKVYQGVYRNSVAVPAGENVLEVHVRSARSAYDEVDRIGGNFSEGGSRTLLIEFGRGSGLKVVNRKLTLRWK